MKQFGTSRADAAAKMSIIISWRRGVFRRGLQYAFAADADVGNSTKLRVGTPFSGRHPMRPALPSPMCTSTKTLFLRDFSMKSTATLAES